MKDPLFAEPKCFGPSTTMAMKHLYKQKRRRRREPLPLSLILFVAGVVMIIIALLGSAATQLFW